MDTIHKYAVSNPPLNGLQPMSYSPRAGISFLCAYDVDKRVILPMHDNGTVDESKQFSTARQFAISTGDGVGSIKRHIFIGDKNLLQIESGGKGETLCIQSRLIYS